MLTLGGFVIIYHKLLRGFVIICISYLIKVKNDNYNKLLALAQKKMSYLFWPIFILDNSRNIELHR